MQQPYLKLFLPDADNPFEQLQAEQAAAVAERHGIRLDVDFARGDFAVQVRQIYQATHSENGRPDLVLVMPVNEAALKSLSEATVVSGIGWVFLNRMAGSVSSLQQLRPGTPVAYVAPDQKEIGRIHARQVRLLFPQGANVLYVHGRITTSSAEARQIGFREALVTAGPKIDVVSALDGNWNAKDSESAIARWLQLMLPARLRVDAVVCQSDYMAAGALEALRRTAEALNLPHVRTIPVLGCDGLTSVGKKLVDDGRLAATIVVPTTSDRAVEMIAIACRNATPLPPELLLAPKGYPDDAALIRRHRQTA
jgi:ABC-type sugar transport system substrate-binding protein